jgi:hypothetical protein
MAIDYTVILSGRQRFGDNKQEREALIETEAPFVGPLKDFPFLCPNVDRSKSAILQFESLGVTLRGVIKINGIAIFGGLTPGATELDPGGPPRPTWKSNCLIVHENVLRDQNTLRIQASIMTPTDIFKSDDFIIDNVVLFFKTSNFGPVVPPSGSVVVK